MHRAKEMQRRWLGLFILVVGIGALPFTARFFEVRTAVEAILWGGTLALIAGGMVTISLGFHVLDLVYLDDQISAFKGFSLEFMKKLLQKQRYSQHLGQKSVR